MKFDCWEVRIEAYDGEKVVMFYTLDDEVTNVYTLKNTSNSLGSKHVVDYHEDISRVKSRLSARDDTTLTNINLDTLLFNILQASRTSASMSMLQKLRSYIEKPEIEVNID